MPEPMLDIEAIDVWRGASQALRGVSLTVEAGEIVAILGANGAGKTTTLATVSGLLRPRAGTLAFTADGERHDLTRAVPERIVALGIAHCPEGRQVFAGLSVIENLMMGAYLRRDGHAIRADLERVGALFPILAERPDQRAGDLSGGEQMMLAIARSLMSRPRLLMLDEPSLGLAPQMIERIFDTIQDIREAGTTILLVEQNAAMALEIADRAYVIESGAVAIAGLARELARNPAVRQAYLGIEIEAAAGEPAP